MKTYCIDPSYTHRAEVPHFDDTPFKDEYQDEVYRYAASLKVGSVIDVGCGSGFKLMKWFGHLPTMGVEVEPTLGWLNKTYPNRLWSSSYAVLPKQEHPVVVICSDVIEHIADPDDLLSYLASLDFDELVISTPDRVLLNIGTEQGPPHNIHHHREWTSEEFKNYVSTRFNVVNVQAAPTCIVHCKQKE